MEMKGLVALEKIDQILGCSKNTLHLQHEKNLFHESHRLTNLLCKTIRFVENERLEIPNVNNPILISLKKKK
jgi:hypothetical protein